MEIVVDISILRVLPFSKPASHKNSPVREWPGPTNSYNFMSASSMSVFYALRVGKYKHHPIKNTLCLSLPDFSLI